MKLRGKNIPGRKNKNNFNKGTNLRKDMLRDNILTTIRMWLWMLELTVKLDK